VRQRHGPTIVLSQNGGQRPEDQRKQHNGEALDDQPMSKALFSYQGAF
jgi:hypothetical protein